MLLTGSLNGGECASPVAPDLSSEAVFPLKACFTGGKVEKPNSCHKMAHRYPRGWKPLSVTALI